MAFKNKYLALIWDKILQFFRNTTTRRVLYSLTFFLVYTVILSVNFVPERYNLKVGQPAPKTIKATRSIEFVDKLKTEEARERAAKSVGKVHEEDMTAPEKVKADISKIFDLVSAVAANNTLNQQEKVARLKEQIPFQLSEEEYRKLAQSDAAALEAVETGTVSVINQAFEANIPEENLNNTKTILKEKIDSLSSYKGYKSFMKGLVENYLRPNLIYNEEETKKKIKEARDAVSPIRVTIQQNEKIIGEGEIVKPEHIAKLEALGLQRTRASIGVFIGIAFMVGTAITLVLIYLYQQKREIYYNENYLFLLGLIVIITLIIGKAVVAIELPYENISVLMGYLVPLAAASMLIAILLDTKLAIVVTAIMSIALGVMTGNQFRFALSGLFSGMAAVYSVSKLSQRSDLAKAGLFYISSSVAVSIISIELITRGFANISVPLIVSSGLILGIMNGVFSAILTIGTLPYLETAFGITSALKLLELSNPNHPLLKRLLVEAPGTYHHSILVGNLAEAAADAVGGESLLVRVGAYYHDIGKVKRPYFFIENQLTSENPHEKIAPSLSTLIITSHTKDGVEMAKEHKLPPVIIDIIEQHHGTSLVSFFFHRAFENDKTESVSEEDFRYEGPKPQTKEAAIVMLADSVEAAVRAVHKPTPGRIEGVVRRVIKEKLNDGQLDECDLTFKDLNTIACAFMRILSGIFHSRIEYPENVLKEIERRKVKDASLRKQSAN